MRYRDADQVEVLPFYARRPEFGKIYRLIGYLGIALSLLPSLGTSRLALLLALLILTWLAAWWQVVGTLWRSSLVAGCLSCAVQLTLLGVGGTGP